MIRVEDGASNEMITKETQKIVSLFQEIDLELGLILSCKEGQTILYTMMGLLYRQPTSRYLQRPWKDYASQYTKFRGCDKS